MTSQYLSSRDTQDHTQLVVRTETNGDINRDNNLTKSAGTDQTEHMPGMFDEKDTATETEKSITRRLRYVFYPFLLIGQSMTKLFTESRPFQVLVTHAFDVCDSSSSDHHQKNKKGEITKDELYVGLLVVHLNLAKYAGPAACYPPTRCVCDALFDAADWDQSNTIDQYEFRHIITIMCTQIIGRIVVYYLVLIVCVPIVANYVVSWTRFTNGSWAELILDQIVNVSVFFVIIPLLWNFIDDTTERRLKQHPHRRTSQIQSMSRRVSTVLMTPTAAASEDTGTSFSTTTIANESTATMAEVGGTSSNDLNHRRQIRRHYN
mmetsp:Transcript_22378/g.52749  ORF Transcript_22378/g.52749 Transcript_22378/m.52749 type:complete len:320 (-) Transcript_22378:227-1186(-)